MRLQKETVMTRFTLIVAGVMLVAGPALAQSQLSISISRDLRRAGVSEACIGRLTSHDFAVLKGISDASGRGSEGSKRQRMRFQAERACGG
jgi:hypothetical protein